MCRRPGKSGTGWGETDGHGLSAWAGPGGSGQKWNVVPGWLSVSLAIRSRKTILTDGWPAIRARKVLPRGP